MDDKYRKHIKTNTERLIRLTDYDKLMHGCVFKGILSGEMRLNIENSEPPSNDLSEEEMKHERHKLLFRKLTKRGPTAYKQLIELLKELEFEAAMQLLIEAYNPPDDSEFRSIKQSKNYKYAEVADGSALKKLNILASGDLPLVQYSGKIDPKSKFTVEKSRQLHNDQKISCYPMKSQHNRGVLFMVNIIDYPNPKERRNGAEEDGQSLLYLFKELGFLLYYYVNVTQHEFKTLLTAVIGSEEARRTECFVMVLMTHGNMDDNNVERVQFHDGSVMKVREIEEFFESKRCSNLVNTPKIFIFPFCRGEVADRGHYPEPTDGFMYNGPKTVPQNIATLKDLIICYASMRGFRAHRDPEWGSWYIQKFYELMAKHAHDTNFEKIIKMTQDAVGNLRTWEGGLQTCSYVNNGFNAELYFNPGIWEEE